MSPKFRKTDNIKLVEDLGFTFSHITGNEAYLYCIFHKDNHASFCVPLNEPVWYCHAASHVGKRGGSLKTLKRLIENTHIYEETEEDRTERANKPEIEYQVAKIYTKDFPALKSASDDKYLLNRGFSAETLTTWDIRKTMFFIVIPTKDEKGNVVGLIIRARLNGWKPKYQYSYGFARNKYLFGIDRFEAKDDIIILVEGSLDAIKMHQIGFTNTLAVLGSSINIERIDILRILGSKIFLFLDPDKAGKEATKDLAKQLINFDVYIPDYTTYTEESGDPAEKEKEEVQNILDKRIPYLKARVTGRI